MPGAMTYRARVFCEGPGWQPRDVQYAEQLSADPDAETLKRIAGEAIDLMTEALKDGRDAERELVSDGGHLPPGVGYQPPHSIVLIIEEVPAA